MMSRLSPGHEASHGLLIRMRNAWTLMLGLIAAIGLGLVAFVSQQGWPSVLDGAIPDPPVELRVSSGAAVSPARIAPDGKAARVRAASTTASRGRTNHEQSADSDVSGSHQVAAAPAPSQAGGSNPSNGAPTTQPTAQSPAAPQAPAPFPTPAPSQSESAASQRPGTSTGEDGKSEADGKGKSSSGKGKGHSSSKSWDSGDAEAAPPPAPPTLPKGWSGKEEGKFAKAGHGDDGDEEAGKSDRAH
jgi:hypothetical protein